MTQQPITVDPAVDPLEYAHQCDHALYVMKDHMAEEGFFASVVFGEDIVTPINFDSPEEATYLMGVGSRLWALEKARLNIDTEILRAVYLTDPDYPYEFWEER